MKYLRMAKAILRSKQTLGSESQKLSKGLRRGKISLETKAKLVDCHVISTISIYFSTRFNISSFSSLSLLSFQYIYLFRSVFLLVSISTSSSSLFLSSLLSISLSSVCLPSRFNNSVSSSSLTPLSFK